MFRNCRIARTVFDRENFLIAVILAGLSLTPSRPIMWPTKATSVRKNSHLSSWSFRRASLSLLNYIRRYSKRPRGVENAVFERSSRCVSTWWKPLAKSSRKVNITQIDNFSCRVVRTGTLEVEHLTGEEVLPTPWREIRCMVSWSLGHLQ